MSVELKLTYTTVRGKDGTEYVIGAIDKGAMMLPIEISVKTPDGKQVLSSNLEDSIAVLRSIGAPAHRS